MVTKGLVNKLQDLFNDTDIPLTERDAIKVKYFVESGILDRKKAVEMLRNHGYKNAIISQLFGVSEVTIYRWSNPEKLRTMHRRKSPQRILSRLGVTYEDELTEEAIVAIKARTWRTRKNIGRELYLRGYPLDEVGRVIGSQTAPYNPITRERARQIVDPTTYEKQLHEERKRGRLVNRQISELCRSFGVNREEFETTFREHYSPATDVQTVSVLSGYPENLIHLYIMANSHQLLMPKQRLDELEILHRDGVDISPSGMVKNTRTHVLYNNLLRDWGSYPNALRQRGIVPKGVYKKPGSVHEENI